MELDVVYIIHYFNIYANTTTRYNAAMNKKGQPPVLSARALHITVDDTEVVRGVDISIGSGEIHAVMGPNGSGKSSLVNTLMGHPKYSVTKGTAQLNGEDILALDAAERAKRGLFLAFQYPKEIAGVTLRSFLFAAYKAQSQVVAVREPPLPKIISPIKFKKFLEEKMQLLKMDTAFAERFVNKGFSGGEKKKAEVLQMAILQPRLALLDETDSGLDIDALQTVAEGINAMRSKDFSALIVTHYARLLDYVMPDRVHVMVQGNIVESGGMELARRLEKEGYGRFGVME